MVDDPGAVDVVAGAGSGTVVVDESTPVVVVISVVGVTSVVSLGSVVSGADVEEAAVSGSVVAGDVVSGSVEAVGAVVVVEALVGTPIRGMRTKEVHSGLLQVVEIGHVVDVTQHVQIRPTQRAVINVAHPQMVAEDAERPSVDGMPPTRVVGVTHLSQGVLHA